MTGSRFKTGQRRQSGLPQPPESATQTGWLWARNRTHLPAGSSARISARADTEDPQFKKDRFGGSCEVRRT